jgi:hypothetical protein
MVDDRAYWSTLAEKIARPVLSHAAAGTLHANMPVEAAPGQQINRKAVTHLEALARTLTGLAPWLELPSDDTAEAKRRDTLADLARQSLHNATDPPSPASPDSMNFTRGGQPLVDAAFLAHALLRAPKRLYQPLDDATKKNLIAALQSTRAIKPGQNNWLCFSAMIEAFLASIDEEWQREPIDAALTRHLEGGWYKGDGAYGDGPAFHFDYYNSFVIHPMLLDIVETVQKKDARWKEHHEKILARAQRYAAVQERLISPEGTYPPIGRSLAYRAGAFHLLAMMSLRRQLPDRLAPAQVRSALTAVLKRTTEPPDTFDKDGWLTIGLAGHQPGLAESYISTGSLYLATTVFLPLGLPPTDEFWTDPETAWTSKRAWSGQDLSPDHAIKD